jgi:hypothetical protein
MNFRHPIVVPGRPEGPNSESVATNQEIWTRNPYWEFRDFGFRLSRFTRPGNDDVFFGLPS